LTFAGQDVECIPPWLASKYAANTQRLDLSYNRLRSLKGLTGFNGITELILDNNALTDDVEFPLMENLTTLTINKNNIRNLETFLNKIAGNVPSLTYLSLLGNQACPNQLSSVDKDENDYTRYRLYVLHRLPRLKFLDSTTVTEAERKEGIRVGEYMKVVTADDNTVNVRNVPEKETMETPYSALPSSSNTEKGHQSSVGKCRYIYYGKQSEGNRFIENNDL